MSTLVRLPLKIAPGRILLVEWEDIYYIEADGGDVIVRTARKKLLHGQEDLFRIEKRLPWPPFLRVHRSFVVNLNRVLSLETGDSSSYQLRLDPPVNKIIPISRTRLATIRQKLKL